MSGGFVVSTDLRGLIDGLNDIHTNLLFTMDALHDNHNAEKTWIEKSPIAAQHYVQAVSTLEIAVAQLELAILHAGEEI